MSLPALRNEATRAADLREAALPGRPSPLGAPGAPVPGLPASHLLRLLRAAVEACPVSITIADLRPPGQPLCFVNAAFLATTGYAAEEVLGRNCRFLQGPGTDPAAVAAMRTAIAARRAVSVELVNHRRDGSPFVNRLELAPLTDPEAGIDAYVGIQRDITLFRAREEQRRERDKLEALGRLAGGFTHELNNLLQPIVTFAELLSTRLPAHDAETAEQLAAITESARAAGDLARRVLHFARRSAADATPAPAGPRIASAARFAARLLPPGVRLELDGLDGLAAPCRLDPTELVQVLGNLLKNAAEAMAGQGTIRLSAAAADGLLRIAVADEGPGMEAETARHVFEPFFTTKPVGCGTGLGLSAVWGLVRGWGGRITLETAPGRGARFEIELPLAAAPGAAPLDEPGNQAWPPSS